MSHHALIIEDDAFNMDILAYMLREQDFEITSMKDARTLEAALKTLAPVDVVFLDFELPGITGFQALDIIRHAPAFAGVPVVACTVHVSEMSVARQMGFHSFLGKPLNAEQFPAQVHAILSGKSVWSIP